MGTKRRDLTLKEVRDMWYIQPLELVDHLQGMLQNHRIRDEVKSIVKEMVQDGDIIVNIDTS